MMNGVSHNQVNQFAIFYQAQVIFMFKTDVKVKQTLT